MEIQTSRFGPLNLAESTFIEFPWGLPGFESSKRFVLLEHREGPFQWLQAVDQPEPAFVVCPPEVLGLHYTVPDNKKAPIEIEREEDLLILVMVSFDRASGSIRPHLSGPLLFNAANRKGYQWSLETRELPKCLVVRQSWSGMATMNPQASGPLSSPPAPSSLPGKQQRDAL